MEIFIENHQKKIPLNLARIQTIARAVLRREDVQACQLNVLFVTHQKIRALNSKYLNRNYATDVLAFGELQYVETGWKTVKKSKMLIADIVISVDAAISNSKVYESSVAYELVLYVVHGILHFLGYDDHNKKDIKKMREREQKIMCFLDKKVEGVLG